MFPVAFRQTWRCVFFASPRKDSEISNGTAVLIKLRFVWKLQKRSFTCRLPIKEGDLM
jgi:hypothetical protein